MTPNKFRLNKNGIADFLVSGFHQIAIYEPGTKPRDIEPAGGPFVDDSYGRIYLGIAPAGGPLATPESVNPSNAINRVESFSFAEPGTYLVICNVAGHFADGMYAFVKVRGRHDR